jgi:hypothetical protein
MSKNEVVGKTKVFKAFSNKPNKKAKVTSAETSSILRFMVPGKQQTTSRYGRVHVALVSYGHVEPDADEDEDKEVHQNTTKHKNKKGRSNAAVPARKRKRANSEDISSETIPSSSNDDDDEDDEEVAVPPKRQARRKPGNTVKKNTAKMNTANINKSKTIHASSNSSSSDDDDDDEEDAAPKKKAVASAKKNPAKLSMAEAFQPINHPLYQKLTRSDIAAQKLFLDPCGQEATDDIIGSLMGQQVEMVKHLLIKVLSDSSNMGTPQNPLTLGTACSGTDAPALALAMIQEQFQLRCTNDDNINAFDYKHVFSCENDPFKQAYLARNFDSVLYPDITKLVTSDQTAPTDVYGQTQVIPRLTSL